MTKGTPSGLQIHHNEIVPPSPVGGPVPCPSWCAEPQGHEYEWDVDAFTRIHSRRFEGTGYGVRVSMMGSSPGSARSKRSRTALSLMPTRPRTS